MIKLKKPPKTNMWKYSTIKIFIAVIIFMINLCLAGAWYFSNCDNFIYSALLNVFGGLFTGLIILSYQYSSNKNLRSVNVIVENLKQLNEIPIFHASERDFYTDYTRPLPEESEDEIDIKAFLNNVLRMSLDYSAYEKKLIQTKQFFSEYLGEIEYVMPPYLLRKHINYQNFESRYGGDEIIEVFNEKQMDAYLKDNPGILDSGQYWIDSDRNPYPVEFAYKNNEEVLIHKGYKGWI